MAENEHGPFNSERDALSTRAAARIRAAFDANPGVGASEPERLKVLTEACEAAGIELGDYDHRFLQWIAHWEIGQAVSLAGMIRRAFEAGKAAGPEGSVTQWAVSFGDAASIPRGPAQRYRDEAAARLALREAQSFDPSRRGAVVSRQSWAGPWTPVPGEDEGQ